MKRGKPLPVDPSEFECAHMHHSGGCVHCAYDVLEAERDLLKASQTELRDALAELMEAQRSLFRTSMFAAQMAGKTTMVNAWSRAQAALSKAPSEKESGT